MSVGQWVVLYAIPGVLVVAAVDHRDRLFERQWTVRLPEYRDEAVKRGWPAWAGAQALATAFAVIIIVMAAFWPVIAVTEAWTWVSRRVHH